VSFLLLRDTLSWVLSWAVEIFAISSIALDHQRFGFTSFLNPQCPLSPVLAIHGNFKELVLRTWKFLEIIFVQSYLGYLHFILG
jgi:hypothetical protein